MAAKEFPKPPLSRREREVAALVADGLTNREIGARLFISERTVDGHLEHIREKLAVNSRAQVAAWFVSQAQPGAASPAPQLQVRPSERARTAIATAALVILLLATGAIALWLSAPNGPIITTVAGSTAASAALEGGYCCDDGPAKDARLSRPSDVAFAGGYLYIADSGNGRIRRVNAQGKIVTLTGGGPTPIDEGVNAYSAAIGSPVAVAVGPDGLTYFSTDGTVGRINGDSTLHLVPSDPISSTGLGGMCFAPDGSLYIADYNGDRVWLRRPDGSLSVYVGTGDHGFSGEGSSALAAHLSYPNRLALDSNGNLFIADEGNNRIRRVDHQTNAITTVAGSSDTYGYSGDGGPATAARLSLPDGVAVAGNGDIYIADTGNNRVRRVDAQTNIITTVAGTGASGFSGDGGAAAQATLDGPVALALTPAGDLYIVDLGNHRIRLIKGVARR